MVALTKKPQYSLEKIFRLFPKAFTEENLIAPGGKDFCALQPRILLIEDNNRIITHHKSLLHKLGFSVDIARSTFEAIKAPMEKYAVVLIRDSLPKINAFLILRFVTAFTSKKSFPLILAMCKVKDSSIENLAYHFAFGAKGFIQLPATLKDFKKKLDPIKEKIQEEVSKNDCGQNNNRT